MYNNRRQFNNGNGFNRNPRRIKQLDPSGFVNKSSGDDQVQSHLSSVSFSDFNLPEKLKRNIEEHGYTNPTFIQEKDIFPSSLKEGTLLELPILELEKQQHFLSPLAKISNDHDQRALILAPTREIAMQIEEELYIFKKGMGLDSALAIGGASMYRQIQELRHNPHFVIGTPGRIKDLIHSGKLKFKFISKCCS